MSKSYIMIIEEGIKTFSLIGHGNDCKISFAIKGQTEPLVTLNVGDKIVGYISNNKKMFSYLFKVQKETEGNECVIVKQFESATGPVLDSMDDDVQNMVLSHEQTESLILITEEQYYKIVDAMMSKCNEEYTRKNEEIDILQEKRIDETSRKQGGINILLYGVPGSGKSWTIEHEYCKPGTIVERLVFHPDYTNADFIGQILPVVDPVDKMVTYEFTPGPFTNILKEAYNNPSRPYVLIIEEINRGNAPAIFGDVFQLLDRTVEDKVIDGVNYPKGTSEYGITNENIAKVVYDDGKHKVRIPSNLSILGTMNTSDQNVFTLDTAFQRRWNMRLIENNFNNVRGSLANAEILDTKVTWKKFCETVNTIIIGNRAKMASAEDKRLGVYFVHEQDLAFDSRALPTGNFMTTYDELNDLVRHELLGTLDETKKARLEEMRDAILHNRLFPEKVIKYLWDDAFKFNPEAIFDTENMDSLEKVIRTFVYNKGADRFKIFKQNVRDTLYPTQQ
ncbi:McrB family protein [Butyribacter sp.]|uniref:McrB family protein n=1 Tax=Butyribacter sp. TaxID=2822465 RepID=UPI002A94DB00|nr:AAA family ATPase [Lachnoclostridium sp.]MDY5180152.1 AAA family ATPase [Butyribacter sp.]